MAFTERLVNPKAIWKFQKRGENDLTLQTDKLGKMAISSNDTISIKRLKDQLLYVYEYFTLTPEGEAEFIYLITVASKERFGVIHCFYTRDWKKLRWSITIYPFDDGLFLEWSDDLYSKDWILVTAGLPCTFGPGLRVDNNGQLWINPDMADPEGTEPRMMEMRRPEQGKDGKTEFRLITLAEHRENIRKYAE